MKTAFSPWSARLRLVLAILVASLALAPSAIPKKRVAVHGFADAEYVQNRENSPQRQTYTFSEGKFFPGASRDGSIDQTTFRDIAELLAKDLVKQNFYPTPHSQEADLLIVVHWGTSIVREDPTNNEALMSAANTDTTAADFDPYAMRFDQMLAEGESLSHDAQLRENARLLGYLDDLRREGRKLKPSDREYGLLHQLEQERYFVVLMAWDYQLLQAKKERKLLWSTRFSVRSRGTNFKAALPLLSIAASDFYGKSSDGLATLTYSRQEYTVEAGELEVVDPEPGDEDLETD